MLKKEITVDDRTYELHTVTAITNIKTANKIAIQVLSFIKGEDMSDTREAFFRRFQRGMITYVASDYTFKEEWENLSESEIFDYAYDYLVNEDTFLHGAEDYFLPTEE